MKTVFSKTIEKDTKIIDRLIQRHDAKIAGPENNRKFVITLKDKDKTIGGLVGETYWNCLYIEILFVPEEARGKGVGTKLIRMAEEKAKKMGCDSALLETHSFHAPNFYKKLGYKVISTITDLPTGYLMYTMYKKIK